MQRDMPVCCGKSEMLPLWGKEGVWKTLREMCIGLTISR